MFLIQDSQQVDAASTRLPANSQPKNKNAIRTGRSAHLLIYHPLAAARPR
jgi:hypothetical protein